MIPVEPWADDRVPVTTPTVALCPKLSRTVAPANREAAAQSSVYFLALPRDFSTGYFRAFIRIFLSAA